MLIAGFLFPAESTQTGSPQNTPPPPSVPIHTLRAPVIFTRTAIGSAVPSKVAANGWNSFQPGFDEQTAACAAAACLLSLSIASSFACHHVSAPWLVDIMANPKAKPPHFAIILAVGAVGHAEISLSLVGFLWDAMPCFWG